MTYCEHETAEYDNDDVMYCPDCYAELTVGGNGKHKAKPADRTRDRYKSDEWEVLDVTGVDDLFTTPVDFPKDATELDPTEAETVRVDLDGEVANSMYNDDEIEGRPVNQSIWFSKDMARELLETLEQTLSEMDGDD